MAKGGEIEIGESDRARAKPLRLLGMPEQEAKARSVVILGIFHDEAARTGACDREIDVTRFTPARAA